MCRRLNDCFYTTLKVRVYRFLTSLGIVWDTPRYERLKKFVSFLGGGIREAHAKSRSISICGISIKRVVPLPLILYYTDMPHIYAI